MKSQETYGTYLNKSKCHFTNLKLIVKNCPRIVSINQPTVNFNRQFLLREKLIYIFVKLFNSSSIER
jgi:hypothetical protein